MSAPEQVPHKTDEVLPNVGEFSAADLEAAVNDEFEVDLRYCDLADDATPVRWEGYYPVDEELKLTLVECKRTKQLTEHTRKDPFVLLFCGRHEIPLCSRVHVVEHPKLGRFNLVLTPVNVELGIPPETHPEGRFYESVVG